MKSTEQGINPCMTAVMFGENVDSITLINNKISNFHTYFNPS